MKARVSWAEERTFIGESGSGHQVVMGASAAGKDAVGASPMELLLLGLGGCSVFDIVLILERGREAVEDCVVEIEAVRAEEDPKVRLAKPTPQQVAIYVYPGDDNWGAYIGGGGQDS